MADAIAKAGLPDHCVLHGLRKAATRRLAEAGCTTLQIMAVTGHKTLAEVERYTEAAQQAPRAKDAISRLPLSTQPRKG
jgi:integrase